MSVRPKMAANGWQAGVRAGRPYAKSTNVQRDFKIEDYRHDATLAVSSWLLSVVSSRIVILFFL